jgi:hypothetical protein
MGRTLAILSVAILIAGLAAPAYAQDGVAHEIDDFVSRTSASLDDNLILGKIRFSPRLDQKFIYDSNIWQNAPDEPETRGEVGDFISSTRIGLKFLLK